jgi:hypothetical protein
MASTKGQALVFDQVGEIRRLFAHARELRFSRCQFVLFRLHVFEHFVEELCPGKNRFRLFSRIGQARSSPAF